MSKNIVICLDGTGNQFKDRRSNVLTLFQMLERKPGEQIGYYDPGVGTMGDPSYKTPIARKINKVMGLAFGRGLRTNIIEAYTYLMENYEDGDKIFLFGFSRGAYTARALAAFIKDCGLFEKGAHNMIPYAMELFKKGAPQGKQAKKEFFMLRSSFRRTYGRKFAKKRAKAGDNPWSYQLRIHFLGLFDTVKSYGWVTNPVVLRNEMENRSILNVRHALAIDERRVFFRQMHWTSSPGRDCKEVWFPGVHSDVGGGYSMQESALAKVALEWMVEEACAKGLKVDPYGYAYLALGKKPAKEGQGLVDAENERYPGPDATAPTHESLKGPWKLVQLLPKAREQWEVHKRRRTIVGEAERDREHRDPKPLLLHQSVIDRLSSVPEYRPPNLLLDPNDPKSLPDGFRIEPTTRSILQSEAPTGMRHAR